MICESNEKSFVLVFFFALVLVLALVFEGVKSKEEPFAPCCRESISTAAKRKKTQPHFQFYRRVKDKCFHKIYFWHQPPVPSAFIILRLLLCVMRILLSCCRSIFPLPRLWCPSPPLFSRSAVAGWPVSSLWPSSKPTSPPPLFSIAGLTAISYHL